MKKILIIEDDLAIRENTAEILELAGYEVLMAEDGNKGMVMALMHHPNLILCDILMPGMNGYELLNVLHQREEFRHVHFIFLTALAEPGELIKGLELGADDYITKPYSAEELLDAIEIRLKEALK